MNGELIQASVRKIEEITKTNRSKTMNEQRENAINEVKKPSSQFILSTSIGVITIILIAVTYYYGLIQ